MLADKPSVKANHTLTMRTGMPSLLGSLAELPTPTRIAINRFVPESRPGKFSSNRRMLRTTLNNSFEESVEERHRSCIRTFREANHDVANSPEASPRRCRKDGMFKRFSTLEIVPSDIRPLYVHSEVT